MPEQLLSLREAAQRTGQSELRLRRWCATGSIPCERDGDEWRIPAGQLEAIGELARRHALAVEEKRVTALAVPVPAVPPDLAHQVASRLGLAAGNVSITRLAIDGAEYVVAVWPGDSAAGGGLPALEELAVELHGELLDGEIRRD